MSFLAGCLDEVATFVGDCVEAVLEAALEDRDTAILLAPVGLTLLAIFTILWAWWPRKKPYEYPQI
jgi:hypothetical protein